MPRTPTMQIAILEALKAKPWMAYFELEWALFGDRGTPAQCASMRRAIGALKDKGAVELRGFYYNEYGISHTGNAVALAGTPHHTP
jgi:hypothetical protein